MSFIYICFVIVFLKVMSVLLFRQYPVKFTISNIAYYCLEWPGNVENSSDKRKKKSLNWFHQTLILVFLKK